MKKKTNSKIPNHIQVDTVSPATKLLEKRRQMYEVHEAFEAQKEAYKQQEEAFKRQEDLIRERDLAIQEELIKYCKFLQENDAKKARAEKRYQEEKEAREKKQSEIGALDSQLQDLQKNSSKLDKKVQALKKYEDYLESVIKAHPDQYQDQGELLKRHEILENSNKNLRDQQMKLEEELERLRIDAAQFEKQKNEEILTLNNELATLTKDLDDVDKQKNKLQTQVEASSHQASFKNLNLGRILMAVDNIHTRCEEGIVKIKDDAKKEVEKVDKIDPKKDKTNTKTKKDKDGKDKKEITQQEEEDDFMRKAERALKKLEDIGAMMADFQEIINECKKDSTASKKK